MLSAIAGTKDSSNPQLKQGGVRKSDDERKVEQERKQKVALELRHPSWAEAQGDEKLPGQVPEGGEGREGEGRVSTTRGSKGNARPTITQRIREQRMKASFRCWQPVNSFA